MLTITAPGAKPGLRRFNIKICTGRETAQQACIARSPEQAWNIAFALCERLLGDTPPRSISVRPMNPAFGRLGVVR